MRAVWGMVTAALSMLAGCVGPAQPVQTPSSGGNPWFEYSSEHFEISSDLSPPDALSVLAEYELAYHLLERVTLRSVSGPALKTHAIVFRTIDELHQFVGPNLGGLYCESLPDDIDGSPVTLVFGSLSPFGRTLFAHELTHRFNHLTMGSLPPWLDEGLAQYYSTVRGTVDAPIVGESDPTNVAASGSVRGSLGDLVYGGQLIPGSTLPKASELVRLDSQGFYTNAFEENGPPSWRDNQARSANYASSWFLVQLMMHSGVDYAKQFRAALATRNRDRTAGDIDALVKRVPPKELDRAFQDYLLQPLPWRQVHQRAPEVPAHTQRALSDAEVLVLWARIDRIGDAHQARAWRRLEQALKSDPKNAEASFWLGRFEEREQNFTGAEEHYLRARELAPHNGRYELALMGLYQVGATQTTWSPNALKKRLSATVSALERDATTGRELTALAIYGIYEHDLDRAELYSDRAIAVSPECWDCLHIRAVTVYLRGDPAKAREFEERAMLQLPDDISNTIRQTLAELLERYSRHAISPPPNGRVELPAIFFP